MVSPAVVHNALLLCFILSTVLHVTAQIAWLTKPRPTAVKLGQDLVLDCQANDPSTPSDPPPHTWLLNGSAVPARALTMVNNSLFLPHFTLDDEGEYMCVVGSGQQKVNTSALVIIAYIKDFVLHPDDTAVRVGSEAAFTCITGRSAPYPMVHWEMDGVRVESDTVFTASYGEFDKTGLSAQISMKLMHTVMDGTPRSFRCVAQNPLSGESVHSQSAKVVPENVDVPPQIVSDFSPEVIAREFQRLMLDCQTLGFPRPSVLWLKDEDYVDDSRVFIMPNRSLVIPSVEAQDAGRYLCVAKNRVGSVTSDNTSIVVAYLGLTFTREPSALIALAGSPVALHCTPPSSVPPAAVTWYKDYAPFKERLGLFAAGVVVDGEERNLQFTSVQKSDEGEYYCVASNNFSRPVSRTSRTARLTVKGAPVITEPPMDTQVVKGRLLHLFCGVDLATVQSVNWTFDGERVLSSVSVSITNHGQELWVNNVGKAWEGWYVCTAINHYGQKSASAYVTVVVAPVMLQELGRINVTVGFPILLPCYIYGDPRPTYVWLQDGQIVFEDSRHKVLSTGLYIDPVSVEDRGQYSCRGNNSGGFAWSNGTLDVFVPPSVDVGDKLIYMAVVGESLTLRCSVQGYPTPTVWWLHNETAVFSAGIQVSADNSSLTIATFTWALSGRYTCVGTNIVDSAEAAVTVHSQVKPRVLVIHGETSININRSLNLTCVIEGVPTPSVTWRHDGSDIDASSDGKVSFPQPGSLLIKFVTKTDEGVYECFATSLIGSSSLRVSVVIVEPPRPPQLLEARALSMHSVLLRWQHVYQAPSTDVDSFVVHYRKRIGGRSVDYKDKVSMVITEKEIEGLEADTEYVFSVSAENSAGVGPESNSLTATTFQAGPSEPKNLRLISTTANTSTISWEVPSLPNGQISLYQVQFKKQEEKDYSVLVVTTPSSSPTQTLMLEFLRPDTTYTARVRAANSWQGDTLWGLFSTSLPFRTNMTAPSAPPSEVKVSVLDAFSVLVTWKPVPSQHQHGPINGYRLVYRRQNETAALGIRTTNSSQRSAVVRGLSPWTWYSLVLEALNPVGYSPKSEAINVRTSPTAPSVSPQGVTVLALPANTLRVDWQPVPAKDRNSELAFYIVQYRHSLDTAWMEQTTPDNETFTLLVSDLSPWSWYEVRVGSETTQVSRGRGPFSSPVQIRTRQAAAGPVRSVWFKSSLTSISLSWSPPLLTNGVLAGYRLDYNPLSGTDEESGVMVVNETKAELLQLHPGVQYNISIAAFNAAGRGNATVIRVSTSPLPAPSTISTPPAQQEEEGKVTAEYLLELTTAGSTEEASASKQLPVIVAGSLTGAAILIILIIFLVCRCFRARQQARAKYLIQGSSFIQNQGSGLYRHLDDSNDISIITSPQSPSSPSTLDSSSSPSFSPSQPAAPPGGDRGRPRSLTDTSWLSQQAGRGLEGPPLYLPWDEASLDAGSPGSLPSPDAGDVYTVQGLDNLGFADDKLTLPGLPPPTLGSEGGASPVTPGEDGADQMSTLNRRKGRMRSENAAAIAVLRSTVVTDDTQFLLSNEFSNVDSEVVFKHRTAL